MECKKLYSHLYITSHENRYTLYNNNTTPTTNIIHIKKIINKNYDNNNNNNNKIGLLKRKVTAACNPVFKVNDWDPEGCQFKPRCSHHKISAAVNPTLLQGELSAA